MSGLDVGGLVLSISNDITPSRLQQLDLILL